MALKVKVPNILWNYETLRTRASNSTILATVYKYVLTISVWFLKISTVPDTVKCMSE